MLIQEFLDSFGSPTCPGLESRYLRLFDNLPALNSQGEMGNGKLTIARVSIMNICCAFDWNLPGFENAAIPVLTKNPNNNQKIRDQFGERNSLGVVSGTVFTGVVDSDATLFYLVRPVRPWYQERFRKTLEMLLAENLKAKPKP